MPRFRGTVAWRVVLDIDAGQMSLLLREIEMLVFEVLVLVLEQDAVEICVANIVDRHLMDIIAP